MSFQDTIDKQLKIVQDYGEIISADEFALICEAAAKERPPGEKWYSKHRELVGPGRKVGAGVVSALTLGVYGIFRQATDRCRQNCKEITGSRKQRCIALCNFNASKHVINHIKSKKGKLAVIKDPEKRAAAKAHLDKEYAKWLARTDKYKGQVASLSAMVTQMQATMKKKKGK